MREDEMAGQSPILSPACPRGGNMSERKTAREREMRECGRGLALCHVFMFVSAWSCGQGKSEEISPVLLGNYADPLREIREHVNQQISEWSTPVFVRFCDRAALPALYFSDSTGRKDVSLMLRRPKSTHKAVQRKLQQAMGAQDSHF
ncbi:unnamed protein product [Leuciscus chuanchicus]